MQSEYKVSTPWTLDAVLAVYDLPFTDLLLRAQTLHRQYFEPNQVQFSTLLSIKTGACPEDCKYCPQSAHYHTGLKAEKLMPLEQVKTAAAQAKANGATRFCMGAAWRAPKDADVAHVAAMVREVKALGMESCVTLGLLNAEQAQTLADAGLDYYNHNVDTSPEFYGEIISTRTFQDRLDTLGNVREAGLKVCSGGIVGMGETRRDRAEMLRQLANLDPPPESVPINELVAVPGTPLAKAHKVDPFEFVRTIAVARILMPAAHVRLSAGRTQMSDEMHALCFMAGANSIFFGDKLLTTANPRDAHDRELLARLGIAAEPGPQTVVAEMCHDHGEMMEAPTESQAQA
ncbi:MAG: biotin synthase BioB [Nevskiaceae bacterium]|nr:MAG: biotin synthase BioB [Nevskiaceae bacterium]TBR73148.1 MAG: biotin synthase BioB [Nevskiaceae bacterium]